VFVSTVLHEIKDKK